MKVNRLTYEDYELSQALESLDMAIEGASKDAWEGWKSISEDVKRNLRNAKSLMRRGKYKEAIPLIEKARGDLERVHSDINARTSWPLSSWMSDVVGDVVGIMTIFNEIDDEVLDDSKKLSIYGVQAINALRDLSAVIPGVNIGGEFLGAIGAIGIVMSNKKFAKQKGLSEKGGFWNRVQRDMLFLINAYIKTCDELIDECELQRKYR